MTRQSSTQQDLPDADTGVTGPTKGTPMSETSRTSSRRIGRVAALLTAAACTAVALTGCGASQEEAGGEKKLEQILTGVDEYEGYGPTLVKVRQGMGEAEIAIAQGVADGVKLSEMDFDYFNATMARSSAYPGTIALHEVYGGLHPILSISEGDTLIAAIADSEGLCYFLRATIDDGKLGFARGLASAFDCMAGTIPEYTTWTAVGAKDWPTMAELNFPEGMPQQQGAGSQGGMQGGNQGGMQGSNQGGMQGSNQGGMQGGMQGGTQGSAPQPGTTTAPGR